MAGSLLIAQYEQAQERALAEKVPGVAAARTGDGSGASGEKAPAKTVVTNATPLSNAELQMLKTLEKRKEVLDNQEKELKRREERVELAEKSLDKKLEELKRLRAEITGLFEQEKKERDDRLKTMVTTICINMKPDQSAAILANMEDEIVLKMFSMIPDKQLSRILEKMDKKKAADLTAAYVKQKKTMPKPPEK